MGFIARHLGPGNADKSSVIQCFPTFFVALCRSFPACSADEWGRSPPPPWQFGRFAFSLPVGSIPLWRDPRNGIDLWCRIAVGGEPSATRVGIGIHALGKLVSAALLFGGGAKQDAIASETKATKEQGLFSKARWSDIVGYKPGSVEVLGVRVRELTRSDVLAQVISVMGSARRAQVMYANA